MTTQTPDKEKQRLIKEVQRRQEQLRCAPKSQKPQLTRELEASKNRLAKLNSSPEEEV